MTLNEIAYNLLNLVRGGRSNTDEHISLEQIKFNIRHYRAMFIRRDYNRNGFSSRHIEQDLGCVYLEPVDASKCCDLPTNCTVYRTKKHIPRTIRYNFEEAISYVGDIHGTGTIPLIHPNTVKFLPHDKYTKDKLKAYMINDHLHIYNAEGLEAINIRGVFEDPRDVSRFDACTTGECYSDDEQYPLPLDMLNMINSGLINGELGLLSGTFSDTANDRAQDDKTITKSTKK